MRIFSNKGTYELLDVDSDLVSTKEIKVLHHIPGRIRVVMPRVSEDELFTKKIHRELISLDFVQDVQINSKASSIVIYYSNHRQWGLTLEKIISKVKDDTTVISLENLPIQAGQIELFLKKLMPTLGTMSLVVGTIGLVLPLLPGAPFLILSSYCFSYAKEEEQPS